MDKAPRVHVISQMMWLCTSPSHVANTKTSTPAFSPSTKDDWWFYSEGDLLGMTYWQPKPDIFPSGLTDWLGEPLVLYVPMYSANNLYRKSPLYDYEWAIADNGASAIPLGRKFYDDLFANGTAAGMIMFEQVRWDKRKRDSSLSCGSFLLSFPFVFSVCPFLQMSPVNPSILLSPQDFLSTHNIFTNLTNSDLVTGKRWLSGMNEAVPLTVTVQDLLDLPPEAPALTRTLFAAYDFFQVADNGGLIANFSIVTPDSPLTVHPTPNRTGVNALGYSYTVVAPVLGGRWIVAEVDKWVAASRRRLTRITSGIAPLLQFSFSAAAGEVVAWAVSTSDNSRKPEVVHCSAAKCSQGQAEECVLIVMCGDDACCECTL